jgi:BlaI family transcriptional regulator, penicillinase repressor
MARPSHPGPTERELTLLKLLWKHGPLTVKDIHKLFSKKPKPAYTSLQTNLQGMLEKGYVATNTSERAHIYKAVLSREKIERETVSDVLERVFDGSALRLITTAFIQGKASKEEIDALQALINAKESHG